LWAKLMPSPLRHDGMPPINALVVANSPAVY
jgi:hypothetical protein